MIRVLDCSGNAEGGWRGDPRFLIDERSHAAEAAATIRYAMRAYPVRANDTENSVNSRSFR